MTDIGSSHIEDRTHGNGCHGKGHSDAAHHLQDWLRLHHAEIFERVAGIITADLSALAPPQLLELGREMLTPGV
jgi:hypothetical protein